MNGWPRATPWFQLAGKIGLDPEMTENTLLKRGYTTSQTLLYYANLQNLMVDIASIPELQTAWEKQGFKLAADVKKAFEEMHFDNLSSFDEVKKRWELLEVQLQGALTELKRTDPSSLALIGLFASTAHAVQDFYSHSNWVNLAIEDHGLKGDAIPLWYKGILIPEGKSLWTGSYGKPGRPGQPTHDTLHKDDPSRKYHADALNVAQRATDDWYDKWEKWLADPAYIATLKGLKMSNREFIKRTSDQYGIAVQMFKVAKKWD